MEEQLKEVLTSDPFAKHLDISVREIEQGYAKASLVVTDELLNFHETLNGGAIFSMSDLVFAVASNTHGQAAVGLEVSIQYVAPAFKGDVVIAEATEQFRNNKIASYRMEVKKEDGDLIAIANGLVYRKKRSLIEG